MACDVPCVSHIALYIISMHIVNSNSRSSASSNHWKLNTSSGKVEPAAAEADNSKGTGSSEVEGNVRSKNEARKDGLDIQQVSHNSGSRANITNILDVRSSPDDHMMEILTSKVTHGDEWIVFSPERDRDKVVAADTFSSEAHTDRLVSGESKEKRGKSVKQNNALTCGKKVNNTEYDHLKGIQERHKHTHIPEPDVAMVFQSMGRSSEVDMNQLEQKLRKAKKDIERVGLQAGDSAAQLYNLIGNFWRIKGNTQSSIECFRKALSISPHHADILINLARVLFNLQYLEDALFLARRSLQLQSQEQNSWLQHFTLGEIHKAHGNVQEATTHFHHALDLNPGFQPAKSHLRDLHLHVGDPSSSPPSVTHLTLFIILFLVIGVAFGVATSIDASFQEIATGDNSKLQPRHFNRAMAMRSIRLGFNRRLCRLRRNNNSLTAS